VGRFINGQMTMVKRKFDLERTSKAVAENIFGQAKNLLIQDGYLNPILFVYGESSVSMFDIRPVLKRMDAKLLRRFVTDMSSHNKSIAAAMVGEFSSKLEVAENNTSGPSIMAWSQYRGDNPAHRVAFIEREGSKIRKIVEYDLPDATWSNLSVFDTKRDNSYREDAMYRGTERVDDPDPKEDE